MKRIAVTAFAPLLLLVAGSARLSAQQEVCKMEMNVAPMTLGEIYAKSEKIAKGWQADAVPARLGNTSLGPIDDKGRSAAWNLMFYSKTAAANLSISTFNGMFTCYAMPGDAGRIPDLKPTFLRDSGKLYAIAKEKGGEFLSQGFQVSIQTAAAPSDRHATWYISYSKADGTNANRTVIVDANTGAVEKVLD